MVMWSGEGGDDRDGQSMVEFKNCSSVERVSVWDVY